MMKLKWHKDARNLYIALAKTAQKLSKMKEAENFIRMSLSNDFKDKAPGKDVYYKSYRSAHYQYGRWLTNKTME